MSKFERYIEEVIKNTCTSFKENLEVLDLREGENGFPESNLTFHFAHAFLGSKNRYIFMQPPFEGGNDDRTDHHFDCFALDSKKKLAIFIETKRLYSLGKLREICSDAARLTEENYTEEILERIDRPGLEVNFKYGLILAEVWHWSTRPNNIEQWWVQGDPKMQKWNDEIKKGKLKDFIFGSQNIATVQKAESEIQSEIQIEIHCCYAFRSL